MDIHHDGGINGEVEENEIVDGVLELSYGIISQLFCVEQPSLKKVVISEGIICTERITINDCPNLETLEINSTNTYLWIISRKNEVRHNLKRIIICGKEYDCSTFSKTKYLYLESACYGPNLPMHQDFIATDSEEEYLLENGQIKKIGKTTWDEYGDSFETRKNYIKFKKSILDGPVISDKIEDKDIKGESLEIKEGTKGIFDLYIDNKSSIKNLVIPSTIQYMASLHIRRNFNVENLEIKTPNVDIEAYSNLKQVIFDGKTYNLEKIVGEGDTIRLFSPHQYLSTPENLILSKNRKIQYLLEEGNFIFLGETDEKDAWKTDKYEEYQKRKKLKKK